MRLAPSLLPLFLGIFVLPSSVPIGLLSAPSAVASTADPAVVGSFGPVFSDPDGHECVEPQDPAPRCKPSAVAIAQLPNGKILYYDGFEGMNRVKYNMFLEYGHVAQNDLSRVMDLESGRWMQPTPEDGGMGGIEDQDEFLIPGLEQNDNTGNDGDLFCSDLTFLPDGRVLAAGGTAYYQEPGVPGTDYGLLEIQGLRDAVIFDPATNKWEHTGSMKYGRWYPNLVTTPDGKALVFGGVTKLVKPIYPGHPEDSLTNVKQTETYDPATGTWTQNPASADKSLPLYARLQLLPDGTVYYDAGGQTTSVLAEYDDALWNLTSVYDPKTQSWKNLGLPTIGGLPLGFRGNGFSVLLPLKPNPDGRYTKASVLSGGGTIGLSPGTYFPTDTATLNTIDTANDHAFTSTATGNLTQPRWFGTGVVLPDGKVFLANGATRDDIAFPGSGEPVRDTEIWDPASGRWTKTAPQANGRTYHNTAMLLPDGRVLLGGHAPAATGYGHQSDLGTELLGLSRATSDPSFQIYSPPYLFWGERPSITSAPRKVFNNSRITIKVDSPSQITSVRMVRNATLTHIIDGDQRTVDLPIVQRKANRLTLAVPDANVLNPGPYMLFANRTTDRGDVPSVSRQVMLARAR